MLVNASSGWRGLAAAKAFPTATMVTISCGDGGGGEETGTEDEMGIDEIGAEREVPNGEARVEEGVEEDEDELLVNIALVCTLGTNSMYGRKLLSSVSIIAVDRSNSLKIVETYGFE